MYSLIDFGVKQYLSYRWKRVESIRSESVWHQRKLLNQILHHNIHTKVGRKYDFLNIRNRDTFQKEIPIIGYTDILEDIENMMLGEPDLLVPGKVKWWAKSSGTTSTRSKYIPVTDKFFYGNTIKACWDAVTMIYHHRPDARLFADKSLILGGSLGNYSENPEIIVGDVSAIMIDRIPAIGRSFYTPDFDTALIADWEEKIERMARKCIHENVVLFGGVPTWNMLLFQRILELTGKENIGQVWPDLHTYLHGGVGFQPYRNQFDRLIGKEMDYYEVYNASEGYFAIQDRPGKQGMLLLTDNGIYYEFIPLEEWGKDNPSTISLEEVEVGKQYAIVTTTFSGLYRYLPGDTVRFTQIAPYRMTVTGRTKHFINVFGEEVMVYNTDQAIALTCQDLPALVAEYTVGPIYLANSKKGGHIWLIEFKKDPQNIDNWAKLLDENLRNINSDYDAKRYKDLALLPLRIEKLPPGTFHQWLKLKGKLGAQHKVPRLSNDRKYVEELLQLVK